MCRRLRGSIPGQEDPLEKTMEKILQYSCFENQGEEPGGLQSMEGVFDMTEYFSQTKRYPRNCNGGSMGRVDSQLLSGPGAEPPSWSTVEVNQASSFTAV